MKPAGADLSKLLAILRLPARKHVRNDRDKAYVPQFGHDISTFLVDLFCNHTPAAQAVSTVKPAEKRIAA